MPLNVIREFIYPFASLLNVAHVPAFENAQSQTSFVREEGSSDFEGSILRRMRAQLVNDVVENEATCTFSTADEGFDDTATNRTESLAMQEPSEVVAKMSGEILQYFKEQCFEINELVLFPELIYDENVQKLLDRLKALYDEHCPPKMSEEQKNELRIQITTEVLTQIHLEDVSSPSPDASFISDKAFSTSEFVSDLLDKFFTYITDDSFGSFKDSLAYSELSSTPQTGDYHEVTAFKKSVADRSGNETFWFAINKSTVPLPRSPSLKRNIINIDDIPLKPPADWYPDFRKSASRLTPISEESRRKLDFGDDSSSDDFSDLLAGGDTGNTYVRFESLDSDIVCETTHFHRTNTVNTTAYAAESVVEFERSEKNTEDGDWMGFEAAKF